MRIVSGACHELQTDPICFGFLLATVRQLEGDVRHCVGEIERSLSDPCGNRNAGKRKLLRVRAREALAAMLT